MLTKTIVV